MQRIQQRLPWARSFRTAALVSFALVILLLAAGMAIALARIQRVTARQLDHVRAEEYQITLVERLRWSGELLVSAGRGYLISGAPSQLADLSLAQTDFDTAAGSLAKTDLNPRSGALFNDAREAATKFRGIQARLLSERRPADLTATLERFDAELLPARVTLREALDRLAGYETAVIENVYAEASAERSHLSRWVYGLLGALVSGCIGVAWVAARRLARTYRREVDALEAARSAVNARDELMGIVAHDLRSPLGAISMRCELLVERSPDEDVRQQAAAINTTATRMAHLIKTLLDVNVIQAGRLTVHMSPCSVDRIMREAFELFSTIAASKHLQLEEQVSEPGMVVLADHERVLQVLSNLVGNAVKFTPTNGRVTMSAERSGDAVAFAIADTGPGIPEGDLPRVFDRYWKDETRGTKGTGLGLFIAKSIVDAHGGRLEAKSSPGDGATFRFTLPATTAPPPVL